MKQTLKSLVKEWRERELPPIIERCVDPTAFIDWNVIKTIPIIGFRRTGKTFLLFWIAKKMKKEETLYINFEDERIPQDIKTLTYLSEVLKEEYGRKRLILLLDEIQNIPNWSKWVRRILDTRNYQIFISGSSSKLSSKEIPTELRGRCLTIELYPLSFKEFLKFRNEELEKLSEPLILNLLNEYINFGGLPEIVLSEKGKKYLLIEEYFKTFLIRDILERYRIRNRELVRELVRILLNSTYITISSLYNTFQSLGYKIGKSTLANYIYYLETSLFAYFVEIFSPKIKYRLKAPRKVMLVDTFFIKKYSRFSENIGRSMENSVFLELKRRQATNALLEIFYWKDYQQNEVDFVLKEGLRVKQLIQVTYASAKDEIEKRELKALLKASKELKCKDLLVITWDYEDDLKINGKKIKCSPLWKWLLT
ncbi:MAG: ATP-binding protein [Candidatus Aenigmarchaeota archaeon]|nr:ATP-binding protein [Candidatus Aenigmarchaeota archaeon]